MKNFTLIFLIVFLYGCDFYKDANLKFGKQHFISAVAHIELHKTRNGEYPAKLSELEFLGDWDLIWKQSVKYEKLSLGYNLYVIRGHATSVDVKLPKSFLKGLGLKDSNIEWASDETA